MIRIALMYTKIGSKKSVEKFKVIGSNCRSKQKNVKKTIQKIF